MQQGKEIYQKNSRDFAIEKNYDWQQGDMNSGW